MVKEPEPLGQPVSTLAFRYGDEAWLFSITQTLRIDAVETVADLKAMELEVMILSGDHAQAVRSVADRLSVKSWHGGLSPADKLEYLQKLRAAGRIVLMVGDGLNDAPALAAASVSLSPASGADVTQAAADLIFMGERLGVVPQALRLCRKGRRVMVENFLLALVYNLLAVPLAMAGWVTPLIAAAAMSGSSVLVVLNALRARSIASGGMPEPKREQAA